MAIYLYRCRACGAEFEVLMENKDGLIQPLENKCKCKKPGWNQIEWLGRSISHYKAISEKKYHNDYKMYQNEDDLNNISKV